MALPRPIGPKTPASDHEGHTHPWPLKLPTDGGTLTCDVCGLVAPVAMIRADRSPVVTAVTG